MLGAALGPADRAVRGLSGPQGQHQLPAAAGRAVGHREQARRRAPLLQQRRRRVQHRRASNSRPCCSPACSASAPRDFFDVGEDSRATMDARRRRSSSAKATARVGAPTACRPTSGTTTGRSVLLHGRVSGAAAAADLRAVPAVRRASPARRMRRRSDRGPFIWAADALARSWPFAIAGAMLWFAHRLLRSTRTSSTRRPAPRRSSASDEPEALQSARKPLHLARHHHAGAADHRDRRAQRLRHRPARGPVLRSP